MTGRLRWTGFLAGAMFALPAMSQPAGAAKRPLASPVDPPTSTTSPTTRSGRDIYASFRAGLADPVCAAGSNSPRWQRHYAAAPQRLATGSDDLLPLFGYVVDALRDASLPTEYALIPFVESGYKPGARSPSGPAGLWQMIAITARHHGVPIRPGYDGRLSAVDSTKAAVRYLKTLHGMFAGDWRLAVMAYNAGEYRIFGALKRSGQKARNADPAQLPGLSDITHAYVRKLHALSCLMEQADDRDAFLHALDRPVPRLLAATVPDDISDIADWAARSGQDAAQLQRLNPMFGSGQIARHNGKPAALLALAPLRSPTANLGNSIQAAAAAVAGAARTGGIASDDASGTIAATLPATASAAQSMSLTAVSTGSPGPPPTPSTTRQHIVARGDNASTIARRYRVRLADLLQRNGLAGSSVLRPGRVLLIDGGLPAVPSLVR